MNFMEQESTQSTSDGFLSSIKEFLSPHDMKRLEAYTTNLIDFHLVSYLINCMDGISSLFFCWVVGFYLFGAFFLWWGEGFHGTANLIVTYCWLKLMFTLKSSIHLYLR